MAASTTTTLTTLGFLTVLDKGEHGLLGGLLVLNATGRPLEFHCTAPVKANRAQEILYGPTIQPYLYGEQIGQALYKKCKAEIQLLFTDSPPVLALRDYTNLPVTLVLGGDAAGGNKPARNLRIDGPHAETSGPHANHLEPFEIAGHKLAAANGYAGDRQQIDSLWTPHAEDFDLFEPFERIRDAIDEAQRGSR